MKWNHQTIGQIFEELARRSGLFRKLRVLDLNRDWAVIVGESIARHSSIVDYSDGLLTVSVTDGMWLHELKLRESAFIEKINEAVGSEAVKRIRFRVG
ncbi:MAG TPA: DUF721 domain-containing protein [Mesotoga infera]|jgi:predicted nucleic acid-binding Zn ribbon protein|nr:DUF721 domain-containing protein [Mesotoga sp.]NLI07392.1 DUF721 domain-containing protein [Thermotogaceae bacterium]HNS66015.1 DUF721 domain-containing protein [Mesotoga infera]HOI34115.1 DUF721 domain-containing protein [Mesotoga infera]HON27637.1 DUF721 domain-containing protein [Mesotoga infera]